MALQGWAPPPGQEGPWPTDAEQAQLLASAELWRLQAYAAAAAAGQGGDFGPVFGQDVWPAAGAFPAASPDALWTVASAYAVAPGSEAQAPHEWFAGEAYDPARARLLAEMTPPLADSAEAPALAARTLESLPAPLRVEARAAAPAPARGSPGTALDGADVQDNIAEGPASWRAAAKTGSPEELRTGTPASDIPDPIYIKRSFERTLGVGRLLGNAMPIYIHSDLATPSPPTASEEEEPWAPTFLTELPSRGAALHNLGLCKPCAWFWKPQKCDRHEECEFCHACPPEALHRKMQERKKLARRIQRSNVRLNSGFLGEGVVGPPDAS